MVFLYPFLGRFIGLKILQIMDNKAEEILKELKRNNIAFIDMDEPIMAKNGEYVLSEVGEDFLIEKIDEILKKE